MQPLMVGLCLMIGVSFLGKVAEIQPNTGHEGGYADRIKHFGGTTLFYAKGKEVLRLTGPMARAYRGIMKASSGTIEPRIGQRRLVNQRPGPCFLSEPVWPLIHSSGKRATFYRFQYGGYLLHSTGKADYFDWPVWTKGKMWQRLGFRKAPVDKRPRK